MHTYARNKKEEKDYQPEELVDEIIEDNNNNILNYPKVLSLMTFREKLKLTKYHEFHPKDHAHHLFMCFPFRDKNEPRCGNPPIHSGKIRSPDVTHTNAFDQN